MKKSLLALAVLGAFAGVAQAQTSVTIYGSFDGGVRYVNKANAAGDSKWTMGSNGTYNSNRLGFKGVEDLGNGMNAHFTLETGFNTGTGTLDAANDASGKAPLFNRTASVGLGGAFGSVDLGRQYSVNFRTIADYDPFNYKYTGIDPLATQGGLTRLNNDIQYTGAFGPVTARAEYALGEVAGQTSANATAALGLSYNNGPLALGGAYTSGKRNVGTAAAPDYESLKNYTVGGAYRFGPARVAAGYAKLKQTAALGAGDASTKDAWIGGSYDVTPAAALTAGYFDTKYNAAAGDGKRKLLMVGATYALSKRTNFYAEADSAKYDGTAIGVVSPAGQDRVTGVSVGINHLF